MEKGSCLFHPLISCIQKIKLLEMKTRFYLLGTNNTQTRFRVLAIDRTEPKELVIYDDKVEYKQEEIQQLLNLNEIVAAFGIQGFVRFLEGYYIILITKRRKVAHIGYHTIYKIEDTSMIYIPNDSVRTICPEESRYVKMFQSIDLSSNFYFSYSYDLTHTLQHNLSYPWQVIPTSEKHVSNDVPVPNAPSVSFKSKTQLDNEEYGIRTKPHYKFVWNSHLIKPVEHILHPDWLLYIVHGFIDQSNMNIFGKAVYITLIARRSSKYAGTRFLKRGANTEGHWSQDIGKMVAKPAITIDLYDPYAETAGAHFNDLLKRYGAPIIILNLVKKREKKKHEKLLSEELESAVNYLNQFLPPQFRIEYKTFDMARKNKGNADVMKRLAYIAKTAVLKTGFFNNKKPYYAQKSFTIAGQKRERSSSNFTVQTGIIRTNCVDCLDRTNTAQFAIGRCALGYQLCALGLLDSPKLEFDTDCVRMLESLYEDHGDTLALQYGGSQLVHRIKTYRKTAPWTSQGNDIMQTLSRYYSNTFSDAEKQNTINLFLGLFVPEKGQPHLWEHLNDYYLHNKTLISKRDRPLTQWWETDVYGCLPYAYNDLTKICTEMVQLHNDQVEMVDAYVDYHRPDELSILDEMFVFKISNSVRDFMPNFTTNYSPFVVRIRPGRRREECGNKDTGTKNPSLTGQSSTSSTTSSTSSVSETETEEDDNSVMTNDSQMLSSKESISKMTFESLFPSMLQAYGTEIVPPKSSDLLLYKKYVLIGKKANGTIKSCNISSWTPTSNFSNDSSFQVAVPQVKPESIDIYKRYLRVGKYGGFNPIKRDLDIYKKYASLR
ncbi:polyphosphoinositide phosphatase isoform X2 [Agrilus planipennis]|uniref:Polyphosphoinositide phosphatase isoform X2 n=1 Tax=Agrilus planipennis TaxID=224129 RepID=A0A1W4XW88_AGRPL|nr:polyphosphoinositide phosphatase isoform X2 [Agrilus planipennis]